MADYGLTRNGSGYKDETAYRAFMSMAKAGEVWTANNGREQVLILKNQGTFCNCLTLTDKSGDKNCIEIISAGTMYTNPGMVKYLFNSWLGTFVQRLPEDEFAKSGKRWRMQWASARRRLTAERNAMTCWTRSLTR